MKRLYVIHLVIHDVICLHDELEMGSVGMHGHLCRALIS